MADGSNPFGGMPEGSSMFGDEFQLNLDLLNQGGASGGSQLDYATLGKLIASAASQLGQQPQQPGYQNMVPP